MEPKPQVYKFSVGGPFAYGPGGSVAISFVTLTAEEAERAIQAVKAALAANEEDAPWPNKI